MNVQGCSHCISVAAFHFGPPCAYPRHLLSCCQTSKANLQRKIQERQADVAAKKQQLDEVLADNEQLKDRIANQTLCKADINRMLAERHKLKEILDSVLMAREELDKKAYEQDVQVRLAAARSAPCDCPPPFAQSTRHTRVLNCVSGGCGVCIISTHVTCTV